MSVTLRFCGATRTVTGSCNLFMTQAGSLLVDCGLFQGPKTLKTLNYGAFPFRPEQISAVLLTHAHIDHSGLLPKLARQGYRGRFFATPGTIDLCSWLLPDAGSIQETEVAALNRRNAARGRPQVVPIYTQADAMAALHLFQPVEYGDWLAPMRGVRARYWNAGHLLGSASIELEFAEPGVADRPLRVLVSGDIGPDAKLFQHAPEAPTGFDYIICEATYGDEDRQAVTRQSRRERLADQVRDAYAVGGPLLMPAFAVERTQELIVDLVSLIERGVVPAAPVFLDSPLAIRATEVFRNYASTLASDVDVGKVLNSPHLRCTESVEDSKSIAKFTGFHVIIAASGMCDAGRIRHHLKRWLWHSGTTVLLTGFQARGTLGRFLSDGVKAVRIQGEQIKVAARIRHLDEYSGHADGPELARWIAARRPIERGVFLLHGEQSALTALFDRISERTVPAAKIFNPILDDVYELTTMLPTPIDVSQRRRLAPEAVVSLDWHNDMSKLILDINDRMDMAADDRARAVIIRRLRRTLEADD
ncbi:MAG TPA: MBL fold metallo-hydrolase [Pseudolabrys sp.]|nr:MBL fold metallo-hydrolase [Pseudolabrys sp.]